MRSDFSSKNNNNAVVANPVVRGMQYRTRSEEQLHTKKTSPTKRKKRKHFSLNTHHTEYILSVPGNKVYLLRCSH